MKMPEFSRRDGVRVMAGAAASAVALPLLPGVAAAEKSVVKTSDHVIYWNGVLIKAFRKTPGGPGPLSRAGAMMNLAIYDVVNSVDPHGKPYLTDTSDIIGRRKNELNTAIDYAAHDTLAAVFPYLNFAKELKAALAMTGKSHQDHSRGRKAGQKTAWAMVHHRRNDGSTATRPYKPLLEPGYWRPEPGTPPVHPHWGRVRPFVLKSGSQLRPRLWGGFGSRAELLASKIYAEEVNLVRSLGGADSTERTDDQTEIARFWANDIDGTYRIGQQYEHTAILVRTHQPKATSFHTAKLFTLQAVAMADVFITAWDAKYEIDFWRPYQAIRLADTDGNDLTVPAPDWQPLSADADGNHFTPYHPSFLSGHCSYGGAWAGAVSHYFGTDKLAYVATTDDPNAVGVTRRQPSISAAAKENADSRLYNGVHYRLTNERSLEHGYEVAEHVTNALG